MIVLISNGRPANAISASVVIPIAMTTSSTPTAMPTVAAKNNDAAVVNPRGSRSDLAQHDRSGPDEADAGDDRVQRTGGVAADPSVGDGLRR